MFIPAKGKYVGQDHWMSRSITALTKECCAFALVLASPTAFAADCKPATYECALRQVGSGEFGPAVQTLEALLGSASADLRSLNLLGIALTGAGETEKANQRFRQAININPRFHPALKNLGINEFTLGQTDLAKSHFEAVLRGQPADDVSHLHLAEIAFDSQDWPLALEHYESSKDRVFSNPAVTLRYADCLLRQNGSEKAISVLNRLTPDQAEFHFQAGTMLGKAGFYPEAAKHFGLSKQGYSDPYSAAYNQVLMFVRGSRFSEAIQATEALFQDGFKRAELYNLVSEAYLGDRQLQQAYDALRTATQIDPKHEKSYGDLISLCMGFSNFQRGLDIANVGLHHLPGSYRLHVQRGVMEAKLGRLAEAQRDFEHAAMLSPEEPLPHATLAIALMQQGRLQEAILSLRQQLQSDRGYFLSFYLLGEALVRSGVRVDGAAGDEALEAFEAAIRLHPAFVPAHVSLGKLLLKRDQVDAAIQHLETAMTLDPDESAPIYQLGRAYQRQGNADRAKELMARVREIADEQRDQTMDSVLKDIIKESKSQAHRTPPAGAVAYGR